MIITITEETKEKYEPLKLDHWSQVPHGFKTDGASNAPDSLFGVDIFPAAVVHDYDYEIIRRTITDKIKELKRLQTQARKQADIRLKANMVKCAPKGFKSWLVRGSSRLYYRAVRRFGNRAIQSDGFQ
jgi:hypothetical protein